MRYSILFQVASVFLGFILSTAAAEHIYNVQDYGAVGDGKTMNTAAIVKALAAADATGGGTILFPAPGIYLSAPFNLTSNIVFFVSGGATLLASNNTADWDLVDYLPSYGQGRDFPGPRYTSFIHGYNLTNVVICGGGTIDGNGLVWWEMFRNKTIQHTRGHLIEILYSSNLLFKDFTAVNSPFWTIHPYASHNITARNLFIRAPWPTDANPDLPKGPMDDHHFAPNTDGFDPDSCSDVLIDGVDISTCDDAIAIKSGWDLYGREFNMPTTDVTIVDSRLQSHYASGVAIGSEMSGGVKNILVVNTTIVNAGAGVTIKSGVGRGGYVHNVTVHDTTFTNCSTGLNIFAHYGGHPNGGYNASAIPSVGDVTFSSLSGTAIGIAGSFQGLPGAPMYGLHLTDINFADAKLPWVCEDLVNVTESLIAPQWSC